MVGDKKIPPLVGEFFGDRLILIKGWKYVRLIFRRINTHTCDYNLLKNEQNKNKIEK